MTLKVNMKFPTSIRLNLDGNRILKKAGDAIAPAVQERLLAGRGAEGPLPEPKSGGKPLNDTGELIESVKYARAKKGKQQGFVFPAGKRADGKRNAMILSVHLALNPEMKHSDPMGFTPDLEEKGAAAAEQEIQRQLAKPDRGLKFRYKELKRIFK